MIYVEFARDNEYVQLPCEHKARVRMGAENTFLNIDFTKEGKFHIKIVQRKGFKAKTLLDFSSNGRA